MVLQYFSLGHILLLLHHEDEACRHDGGVARDVEQRRARAARRRQLAPPEVRHVRAQHARVRLLPPWRMQQGKYRYH